MAHYAKVHNGLVEQVIVADSDYMVSFVDTSPGEWIQTSYNTSEGIHRLGGTPLRKNYAGIGFKYDSVRDAFYAPQPFPSWTLNEDKCIWEAPVASPEADSDEGYKWNEETTSWQLTE
tara:strand:- start:174 stop:527 length:354 start_codon:yes stop_codon:yes gene_type:complete